MLRHSLLKKIFCASLIASQVFAIIPATNAFAVQNTNTNISTNKQVNTNWAMFAFKDEEQLKANIIQSNDFIKNWANVAHYLGFGWCCGTKTKRVGDDFSFRKVIENGKVAYVLKANYDSNDTHASGYRANERLEMKISNVRFVIDPSTIQFGKAKITEKKPLIASSAYATNHGTVEDDVEMKFKYSSSETSSKTDNVNFTEGIGIKTTFQLGVPYIFEGKAETNFDFSSSQGWSNTQENNKTTEVSTKYAAKVPAKSKRLVELVSIERKSDVPYTAKIYMEYDVTFNGFLRWGGNAQENHPDDRPVVSVTFGGNNNMSAAEHILDMYNHKDINGYSEWDWNWMINKHGQSLVDNVVDKASKTRYGGILTGVFTGIDGTHVDIKARKPKKINSIHRRKRSLEDSNMKVEDFKTYDLPNIKVDGLTVNKNGVSEVVHP